MLRTAVLLSLLSSPAFAFQARNNAEVSGTAERIVVASRPGLASSESWCAAGDFVIRALGMPSTTKVYRISPMPRKVGEPVEFSLSATGATDRSGLLQLGPDDAELSAGHAQSLCNPVRQGM